MDFALEILVLLFVVALIAGWIDAVAGGGGLITVPVMLLIGVPPAAAIATNKLQGSFGTFSAALYFVRQRAISLRQNWFSMLTVCIGSVFGGWLLTQISTCYLSFLVPILLMLTGLYFLFFAGNLDAAREPRMSEQTYNLSAAPMLGCYDGFFGPGAGSFLATTFVTLRGFPIRKATAHAKLLNAVSNFSALVYFIFFGQIFWTIGAVMIGGQLIGANLGARTALHAGAKIIRPVIVIVCFAMSARMLWGLLYGT